MMRKEGVRGHARRTREVNVREDWSCRNWSLPDLSGRERLETFIAGETRYSRRASVAIVFGGEVVARMLVF